MPRCIHAAARRAIDNRRAELDAERAALREIIQAAERSLQQQRAPRPSSGGSGR